MSKNTARMKDRRERAANALRKAGYVPVPRWWVTPDELDVIGRMARNHNEHVQEIRNKVLGKPKKDNAFPD